MQKCKILDISLQQDYIGNLTTALPLCILLSDEKHKGWFYEHYIKLFSHLDYDKSFECELIDALNYNIGGYWDTGIIRFSYVPDEIMRGVLNIHDILKKYIEDQTYCVLFVDEYYIDVLNKGEHFAHEVLIYGFDDNNKIYNVVAFQDKKFTKMELKFHELEYGYDEAFKYIKERNGWETRMFMQFRPVRHPKNYPFSLSNFIESLSEYINSHYSEKERYLSLFDEREENIPDRKLKEGISVELDFIDYLKKMQKDIKDKKRNIISRYLAFHNLRDHKKFILDRLAYVNTIYSNENIGFLIHEYNEIMNKSELIRLLYIKINFNLKSNNFTVAEDGVELLIKKIKELFKLEKQTLSGIISEYSSYFSSQCVSE